MWAIDYLLTRPEGDCDRIGDTGISAGGATTLYLEALDERVSAAMINSYLSMYALVCLDVEHCPCNDIPGIARDAEMGDVTALIAPPSSATACATRSHTPRRPGRASRSFSGSTGLRACRAVPGWLSPRTWTTSTIASWPSRGSAAGFGSG